MSESEASSAPGSPSSGGRLQLSSFGWLLTGGAFVYVAWRILGVSGYDTNTALAVVQAGGAGNVALGIALASAAPVVLLINILWWLAVYFEWQWVRDLPNDMKISLAAPLQVPTLFLLPAGASLVSLLFFVWMTYLWKRPKGHSPNADLSRAGWALVIFVAWIASPLWLQVSSPWLPSEELAPKGEPALTAYVLGTENGELVVLQRGEEIKLRRVPVDGLQRNLCSNPKPWPLRSVRELLPSEAPYPRCP
jgi:hypothetical protein